MALIISDNRYIERSLQRNVALSAEAGAELSDDLVINCADGNLSVEAPPASAGELLIRLPWDCLLPVDFFQLSVANDEIAMASHEAALTPECVARMEALVELYNLTEKLARHRRMSAWPLLASHPELLEHVGQRLPGDLSAMFQKYLASGNNDELMLDSFLHTRAFDYRENESAPPFPVLMPVIDFLNHHLQGAIIEDHPADDRSLTIRRSVPVPGAGDECHVFYGLYDAFDTWVSYGFVDEAAPFVRSIPMTIDLPGLGTLRLANFIKLRPREDLPPAVVDLHLYIPKVLARRGDHIEVASLLLPGPQAPEALRRTLSLLINEMSPGHPRQRDLVMQAEEQIIAANRTYNANLLAALQALALQDPRHGPIRDSFVRMCTLQLSRIERYPAYAGG